MQAKSETDMLLERLNSDTQPERVRQNLFAVDARIQLLEQSPNKDDGDVQEELTRLRDARQAANDHLKETSKSVNPPPENRNTVAPVPEPKPMKAAKTDPKAATQPGVPVPPKTPQ